MTVEAERVVPEVHRTMFLSDLHLGAHGCRADAILAFLAQNDAETIFLVGDIFDIWDPLILNWGARQDRIVEILRARAAAGRRLVYLVGNHDRALAGLRAEEWPARARLGITVQRQVEHRAADGMLYLVLHGDVCDARLLRFHICTRLGSRVDGVLRLIDSGLRALRLRFGREARGPIEMLLRGLNTVLYRSHSHERRLVALAEGAGCDGIICGHFHLAALHDDHRRRYANCGDWTDNCTAIVENWDGRLRLLAWDALGAVPEGGVAPVLAPAGAEVA